MKWKQEKRKKRKNNERTKLSCVSNFISFFSEPFHQWSTCMRILLHIHLIIIVVNNKLPEFICTSFFAFDPNVDVFFPPLLWWTDGFLRSDSDTEIPVISLDGYYLIEYVSRDSWCYQHRYNDIEFRIMLIQQKKYEIHYIGQVTRAFFLVWWSCQSASFFGWIMILLRNLAVWSNKSHTFATRST